MNFNKAISIVAILAAILFFIGSFLNLFVFAVSQNAISLASIPANLQP